jgi:hypothetical protein
MCVRAINFSSITTIFQLYFGTDLVVWYVLFFILLNNTEGSSWSWSYGINNNTEGSSWLWSYGINNNTEGSSWSWSYGINNYLCNQCLSPLTLWVRSQLRRGVLDTTLCDKVCQWLAAGQWFSTGTPVSSTNKTDRHDITEIVLNTITLTFEQHW